MFHRLLTICFLTLLATASAKAEVPTADYFIGRWGQVSFNDDNDLPKMITMARGYCGGLATPITRKSDTTFMMYVTDQLKEVEIMEQDGKYFIVPAQAEEGILKGARELEVKGPNVFTLKYIENQHHSRYGPNVFVRCGSKG